MREPSGKREHLQERPVLYSEVRVFDHDRQCRKWYHQETVETSSVYGAPADPKWPWEEDSRRKIHWMLSTGKALLLHKNVGGDLFSKVPLKRNFRLYVFQFSSFYMCTIQWRKEMEPCVYLLYQTLHKVSDNKKCFMYYIFIFFWKLIAFDYYTCFVDQWILLSFAEYKETDSC